MFNRNLAKDYIKRSEIRLKAIQVLFDEQSWADVVRECQEVVELSLKALLRSSGIEAPRIHDVSQVLEEQKALLPKALLSHVDKFAKISKNMRRDREIAFYGSEDLTPSEFYSRDDAELAISEARYIVDTVKPFV